ncbi:MAG: hypothetical protein RL685_4897 [Pseudomonadota bacterium]|jgi:hypothetical protein
MSTSLSPTPSLTVVCPPNIGPAERRKRLIVGAVALCVCVGAAVLLSLDGAPRYWRLLLFLPFWTAALGIFQARAQVCVALASRGVRNLEGQQEPQPAAELAAVRKESQRVHVRSLLTALALTALCFLILP